MPSIHDFRSDFRRGRTGDGLRINQQSKAYFSSVYDANNMMVTLDGRLVRRWGTEIRMGLPGAARIEGWVFAEDDASRFLLLFEDSRLTIYDMALTQKAQFTGQPWDVETAWFLTLASESNRLFIADSTFRTQILTFDVDAGAFGLEGFSFEQADSGARLRAPFTFFGKETLRAAPTIFTSAGEQSAYGTHIATALGISSGDFDLAAGTGKLSTNEDFFDASHAGTRMRLGAGEMEVNTVTDARNATITIKRDIAVKLDTDPFLMRRSSAVVEVAAPEHGLTVGDDVFFYGLSTESTDHIKSVLTGTPQFGGSVTGTASTYTVTRVVDENHFEIEGDASVNEATGLYGGSSVYMIPAVGLPKLEEPAFSDARGWPQAAAIHESRLWLGGTRSRPDAAWASAPFSYQDFDTGEGNPEDAIAMYGIGQQSRVRHFVADFDLIILCDNGEFYVPGSTEQAITQSSARALSATRHGAAFTTPHNFDGAVFFLDKTGGHVRELQVRSSEQGYYAPPASVVVPDWIKKPKQAVPFPGSPEDDTPYLFWANDDDGALVVMHSARSDEAFGFMRWTLKNGRFVSVATVGQRLFAVAERAGGHFLLEFVTDGGFPEMDFAETLSGGDGTNWAASRLLGDTLQLASAGRVYSDVTPDASTGAFTTPEALGDLVIGDGMPWLVEMNAPAPTSGQGPKAGKMQRLVSAEIHWDGAETGTVAGMAILTALDNPQFQAPLPVSEWREYYVGMWDREPRLRIEGGTPGRVAMRAAVLNVYF